MSQAFHEVVRAMKQRWTTTEIVSGKSDLSTLNRMVRTIAASNLSSNDQQILEAAKIAEALATTMYTNIVKGAPFFRRLSRFDQSYFRAAREVEMEHYRLLKSATGTGTPIARFYFPQRMFVDAEVTLDTLVTLEEAFVAAYIVGVRDLSNDTLKVIAARIMGVESDHRTVGRVVAQEIDPRDAGLCWSRHRSCWCRRTRQYGAFARARTKVNSQNQLVLLKEPADGHILGQRRRVHRVEGNRAVIHRDAVGQLSFNTSHAG